MKKELFGVFDSREEFNRFRDDEEFDQITNGNIATIGIREPGLDIRHRSATYEAEDGVCVIWGEVYLPTQRHHNPAEWLLQEYSQYGRPALSHLNGSYLVYIECNGEAALFNDPLRSWECFYTDEPKVRVFGTDALQVGSVITEGTISAESMFELAHMSTVLGNRTLLKELNRVPFDGYLTATETGVLDRFSYQPKKFDYANELAQRLDRALKRRKQLPGRKGLLLGAGYDSRTVLARIPDINWCFTVGTEDTPEVQIAKRLSEQYNTHHRTLSIDEDYMNIDLSTIRYTNGIGESIHIHQRGIENIEDLDTVYHGWGIDALLKDFFIEKQRIGIRGKSVRRSQLADKPDPAGFLLDKRLGIMPGSDRLLKNSDSYRLNNPKKYIRDRLEQELDSCRDRCENEYDVTNIFGIKNLPSKPFRMHLADNYLESFLCADKELIDWHLQTPPEHRNTSTFLKAIQQLDPEILRYRPPDRPRSIQMLNPIEGFLRRTLPIVSSFGRPWPNPDQLYDRYELDQIWFPNTPSIHPYSARLKLRIHDIVSWLNTICECRISPEQVLYPTTALGRVTISKPDTPVLPIIHQLENSVDQTLGSIETES